MNYKLLLITALAGGWLCSLSALSDKEKLQIKNKGAKAVEDLVKKYKGDTAELAEIYKIAKAQNLGYEVKNRVEPKVFTQVQAIASGTTTVVSPTTTTPVVNDWNADVKNQQDLDAKVQDFIANKLPAMLSGKVEAGKKTYKDISEKNNAKAAGDKVISDYLLPFAAYVNVPNGGTERAKIKRAVDDYKIETPVLGKDWVTDNGQVGLDVIVANTIAAVKGTDATAAGGEYPAGKKAGALQKGQTQGAAAIDPYLATFATNLPANAKATALKAIDDALKAINEKVVPLGKDWVTDNGQVGLDGEVANVIANVKASDATAAGEYPAGTKAAALQKGQIQGAAAIDTYLATFATNVPANAKATALKAIDDALKAINEKAGGGGGGGVADATIIAAIQQAANDLKSAAAMPAQIAARKAILAELDKIADKVTATAALAIVDGSDIPAKSKAKYDAFKIKFGL